MNEQENPVYILGRIPFQRCTDNNCYITLKSKNGRTFRAPRPELHKFKKDMVDWAWLNKDVIELIKSFIPDNTPINMRIILGLTKSRLWTKDGRPKKIDALNWTKAMIDCLAIHLERDDKLFWNVRIEKAEIEGEKSEYTVMISKYQPRSYKEANDDHPKSIECSSVVGI